MRVPFCVKMMQSRYCQAVFVLAFIISYFLIPSTSFQGHHAIIAVVFMIVFSLSAACIVRNIKEKINAAKHAHKPLISIIAAVIGLSAMQFCGVGAPICTASASIGIVSLFIPNVIMHFISEYSIFVIATSIFIQLFVLYRMNCFKNVVCN